jgi:hypothetical protein
MMRKLRLYGVGFLFFDLVFDLVPGFCCHNRCNLFSVLSDKRGDTLAASFQGGYNWLVNGYACARCSGDFYLSSTRLGFLRLVS